MCREEEEDRKAKCGNDNDDKLEEVMGVESEQEEAVENKKSRLFGRNLEKRPKAIEVNKPSTPTTEPHEVTTLPLPPLLLINAEARRDVTSCGSVVGVEGLFTSIAFGRFPSFDQKDDFFLFSTASSCSDSHPSLL